MTTDKGFSYAIAEKVLEDNPNDKEALKIINQPKNKISDGKAIDIDSPSVFSEDILGKTFHEANCILSNKGFSKVSQTYGNKNAYAVYKHNETGKIIDITLDDSILPVEFSHVVDILI